MVVGLIDYLKIAGTNNGFGSRMQSASFVLNSTYIGKTSSITRVCPCFLLKGKLPGRLYNIQAGVKRCCWFCV